MAETENKPQHTAECEAARRASTDLSDSSWRRGASATYDDVARCQRNMRAARRACPACREGR